jgi:nucleotide-binding universal stress UspA family protein
MRQAITALPAGLARTITLNRPRMVGSVAVNLAHHSPVPVTIVP